MIGYAIINSCRTPRTVDKAEEQEGRGAWFGKSARGIEGKLGKESVKKTERDGGAGETA